MADLQPVQCSKAISKSTYQAHEAGVGLLSSLVPFIGPSLAQLISPVPNMQSQLAQATNELKTATKDWQTQVTNWIETETDLVDNFITLMLGEDDNGNGYIDTAIAFASQKTNERVTMLTVNFVFLAVIVAMTIYYVTSR